ncbi:unnamed protein product [Adineta ricciae]|uniref:TIR domain-containing protein n=1 Tax=Adineta ricciae TaxID=249248 RepID=A0A814VA54_ADIRI|nr:unnamed protein product [Adineta ricciae]
MSLLTSVIDKFALSCTKDNEIGEQNQELYDLVFDYFISSDVVEQFTHALRQLDTTSPLNESSQWLLITGFNAAMDIGYYDNKHRDTFCEFWLPKYEVLLQEFIESLSLHVIKYILSSLIQIQITIENLAENFMRQELEFCNLKQNNEYLAIIQTALPLVIKENFLQNLHADDYSQIDLRWDADVEQMTSSFISWLIFKILLMFTNTDGDCFTMVKHNLVIKNILLRAAQLIDDQHPVKLALRVIIVSIINESEIQNTKETINILIENIKKINYLNGNRSSFSNNGVYDIELLIGLKGMSRFRLLILSIERIFFVGFLQYNQVQSVFLEKENLDLLIVLVEPLFSSVETEIEGNEKIDNDLTPSKESTLNATQLSNEATPNDEAELNSLLKDMALIALECLHLMLFNQEAKTIIKDQTAFVSFIREIEAYGRVRKAIDGFLWKLDEEDETQNEEENNRFDLMISYDEDHDSSLVKNLYNYLAEHCDYRISFDEQSMPSSRCQAIVDCQCVLLCVSETYKSDPNCRMEVEHARSRNKRLIPFVLKQTVFDGWLGSICTNSHRIDSVEHDFDKSVRLLIDEIQQERLVEFLSQSKSQLEQINVSSDTDYKTISSMELWTNQHVQHFLYDNKLDVMVLLTEQMNGEDLRQLFDRCQIDDDYWAGFDRLNQELEKRFRQVLPISVYIRFLNRIRKYITVSMF